MQMHTFLAAVDELTSVHALNSQKVLFPGFVPVWIPEMDYSQRGTTTRVMDDVLKEKWNINKLFQHNRNNIIWQILSETTSRWIIIKALQHWMNVYITDSPNHDYMSQCHTLTTPLM